MPSMVSPTKPSPDDFLTRASNYSPTDRDVWYNQQRLPQHLAREDTDRDRGKLLWERERDTLALQRPAYNNLLHAHWGQEGGSTLSADPTVVMMRPDMSAWHTEAVPQTTTFTFVKSTPQANGGVVGISAEACSDDEVVDPRTPRTARGNRKGKGKK